MKLSKEFFLDSKNAKHIPSGVLRSLVSGLAKEYFGENISSGKVFVIDSDIDRKIYFKVDQKISDWEKKQPNLWVSSFTKMIKFYNVADRTSYIVYKNQ